MDIEALFTKKLFTNVVKKSVVCYCPAHNGVLLKQFEADLPNGKRILIQLDDGEYHVMIGNQNSLGDWHFPINGVDKQEVKRLVMEALWT